ncbi:Npp1 protein, partial [Globisporangium polare]
MTKDSIVDKTENGDYADFNERDSIQLIPKRSKASVLAVKSAYLRECLAEFIGTAILIAFG